MGAFVQPRYSFVRLSLLERVRPETLLRVLRPFEGYLGDQDVHLGDEVDLAWIGRLHGALCAVDPAMPAALQRALHEIADVAHEEALLQGLELAGERHLALVRPGTKLTAEDVAFEMYLEHREHFETLLARAQSKEAQRFVEFFASYNAPLEGASDADRIAQLEHRVGSWFANRNCTGFCEVRVLERANEVTLLVIHGRTPRSVGVITEAWARGRTSFVPDSIDTVVFDRSTCRLSVNARWPAEQDHYREVMGSVFFGDGGHFLAHEVYTGEPLVEDGARALSPVGIQGLDEVVLQRVEVQDTGVAAHHLSWRGRDLGHIVGTSAWRAFLDARSVTHIKLALKLRGRRRRVPVEIAPPNRLTYDRRLGDAVVREFLLVRGFMRLPARDELRDLARA